MWVGPSSAFRAADTTRTDPKPNPLSDSGPRSHLLPTQHNPTQRPQDAGWALSYISDGDNERIQAVIDAGCCPDLVRHLGHALGNVVTPMLRTLGNLVSGDDGQTQGACVWGIGVGMCGCLVGWLGEMVAVDLSWQKHQPAHTCNYKQP